MPPPMMARVSDRVVRECVPLVAELEVERPGNLREQVDVDERPDDEVEDLLDHVAGEDARERRATHDRHEHEQGDERAHVRGHVVVQRDADCVRSQYLHVRRTARIRVAEDPVPAERGEHSLEPLEDAPDEDVDDGDVRDPRLSCSSHARTSMPARRSATTIARVPTSQAAMRSTRRRGCSTSGATGAERPRSREGSVTPDPAGPVPVVPD